jgi:hypothetical protein
VIGFALAIACEKGDSERGTTGEGTGGSDDLQARGAAVVSGGPAATAGSGAPGVTPPGSGTVGSQAPSSGPTGPDAPAATGSALRSGTTWNERGQSNAEAVTSGACDRARACCPVSVQHLRRDGRGREDPCRTLELAIASGGGAAEEACLGALEAFRTAFHRAGRDLPEPCR